MKKIKLFMTALGLLLGGIVLGQAFDGDVGEMLQVKPTGITNKADKIYETYGQEVAYAKSAVQISQLSDEARVRLEYLQIKQNAEIIRLLGEIKDKK